MKVFFEKIVSSEGSRYRVSVSVSGLVEAREFVLVVSGGDIRVVSWSDDFAQFMGHNMGPAKSLMEAILALDRSQGLELP
jgi:hypothetical protein